MLRNTLPPTAFFRNEPEIAGPPVSATPSSLREIVTHLGTTGAAALAGLPQKRLLDAWSQTVAAFRDPTSPERRALDPTLAESCRLSRAGLEAGLEAVLGGVRREAARRLAERMTPGRSEQVPVLVVLASNLPGLAVQPLLPALLARRPVVLKSPSAEPFFTPAFLRALAKREPVLGETAAALTWRGGDVEVEAPLLASCDPVLAYGEQAAIDDLIRRSQGRVIGYGPKVSLAVVGADADFEAAAAGIARDVALFDQRGCLSIHAVYTDGDAEALAARLAAVLTELADTLPPGPIEAAEAAAVQHVRAEAEMRGCWISDSPLSAGTVIVEPELAFRPSPGLRTVRVHRVRELTAIPTRLATWKGKLQGAALAGRAAWKLTPSLEALGFSRFSEPGDLQSPDAMWHNGGVDPALALRVLQTKASG